MNKLARVGAALRGQGVDRPPISLWMHYPEADQDPLSLAKAHVAFQERHDLDFIKLTPFDLYPVEDWGCQVRYFCTEEKTPEVYRLGVRRLEDWRRLEPIPPEVGAWGKQLMLTRHGVALASADVPVVQTVYSPLTVARKLAGERLVQDLRMDPLSVHHGLEVITETTIHFVKANLAAGAAGIFFATTCAAQDFLTPKEYDLFARRYDLRVLQAAAGGWFNTLHIHGSNILFDELLDYPVHALNWHDSHEYPPLRRARGMTELCIIGGLDESGPIAYGTPAQVIDEVAHFLQETNLKGVMVGPGCVTPPNPPANNVTAARLVVERYGDKDIWRYLSQESACL